MERFANHHLLLSMESPIGAPVTHWSLDQQSIPSRPTFMPKAIERATGWNDCSWVSDQSEPVGSGCRPIGSDNQPNWTGQLPNQHSSRASFIAWYRMPDPVGSACWRYLGMNWSLEGAGWSRDQAGCNGRNLAWSLFTLKVSDRHPMD